jgi:hypothetical protein
MEPNRSVDQSTKGPYDPRPDIADAARFSGQRSVPAASVLDAYFPNEETVTMLFENQVNLRLDNFKVITFAPGYQEVPVSIKDHWYLKANGAKEHVVPAKKAAVVTEAPKPAAEVKPTVPNGKAQAPEAKK